MILNKNGLILHCPESWNITIPGAPAQDYPAVFGYLASDNSSVVIMENVTAELSRNGGNMPNLTWTNVTTINETDATNATHFLSRTLLRLASGSPKVTSLVIF